MEQSRDDAGQRWRSHLQYCDFGYTPVHRVDLDLVRLGALCGAANGLIRGPRTVRQVGLMSPLRVTIPELAEGCGRVALGIQPLLEGGDSSIDQLSHQLRVHVESRGRVIATCDKWKSGWCPPSELLCEVAEATVTVDTGTGEQAVRVGLEVWHRPQQKP